MKKYDLDEATKKYWLEKIDAYIKENYVEGREDDSDAGLDKSGKHGLPFAGIGGGIAGIFGNARNIVGTGLKKTNHLGKADLRQNMVPDHAFDSEIENALQEMEDSFSDKLLELIRNSGKTEVDVYSKAEVSRKVFSKIRSDKNYKPNKKTAISFAIALELPIEEAQDLLSRAGYTLTRSSEFDIAILCFLEHELYDLQTINSTLFQRFNETLAVKKDA